MKSVKFSRESQSKSSCTSDSKMNIFTWLSNIYRWRIYLWNVSYALRKTAHLKHIKQRESLAVAHAVFLSEHLTASCFKLYEIINYRLLYLSSLFFKAFHIKLVTCLEQIVLCTFSTAVQSVSSLDIFSDALVSNYCISILTVLLHTVSLIKYISIYRPALVCFLFSCF